MLLFNLQPFSQPMSEHLGFNIPHDPRPFHAHNQRMVQVLPHLSTDEYHTPYTSSNTTLSVCLRSNWHCLTAPCRRQFTIPMPRYFIDCSTKWIEDDPVFSITTKKVNHVFLTSWISRFGVSLYITTDSGTHIETQLFT